MSERNQSLPYYSKRPDGTRPCRGSEVNPACLGNVVKPRVTWCSKPCIDWCFAYTSQNGFRYYLANRDRGVCRSCGADTNKLERVLRHAASSLSGGDWGWRIHSELHRFLGLPRAGEAMWAADHIVALTDGGSNNPDTNGQTLCVGCHKEKTAREAGARAVQRRWSRGVLTQVALF